MKKIIILGIITVVFCFAFSINFALANSTTDLQPAVSTETITSYTDLAVTKTFTIGTKKNKGKLYVKGAISNQIKKKPVLVKDDLKVTGDLEVKGKLKGVNVIQITNIKNESITGAKIADATINKDNIDFSSAGFVKAAGIIDCGNPDEYEGKGCGTIRFFNNVNPGYIDVKYEHPLDDGTVLIDLGLNPADSYAVLTPYTFRNQRAIQHVIINDPTNEPQNAGKIRVDVLDDSGATPLGRSFSFVVF